MTTSHDEPVELPRTPRRDRSSYHAEVAHLAATVDRAASAVGRDRSATARQAGAAERAVVLRVLIASRTAREEVALDRRSAADARADATDVRTKQARDHRIGAAATRAIAAARRDEIAARRDAAADVRDAVAARRDALAAGRDDAASRRDALADDRDDVADARDRLAEGRDTIADTRVAAGRDSAAADRTDAGLEMARLASELRSAHLDDLTGADRRETGMALLAQEIDRARRGDGRFVIAFADVDGLKQINDEQGHAAGDHVLRTLGALLRDHLRSFDRVVRYGGDEFVAGLGAIDLSGVQRRFDVIDEALRSATGTGITSGLAALDADETLDELIARADAALLEEKPRHRSAGSRKVRERAGSARATARLRARGTR